MALYKHSTTKILLQLELNDVGLFAGLCGNDYVDYEKYCAE